MPWREVFHLSYEIIKFVNVDKSFITKLSNMSAISVLFFFLHEICLFYPDFSQKIRLGQGLKRSDFVLFVAQYKLAVRPL
jgi:hypothetical protein